MEERMAHKCSPVLASELCFVRSADQDYQQMVERTYGLITEKVIFGRMAHWYVPSLS